MELTMFGHTGLRVSQLGLGTMTFGEEWGWGAPKAECARILDSFLDRGGNFVDTANMYTNGSSERILGELLQGRRDRVVLGTKYTNSIDPTDPTSSGNGRKSMIRSVEASLGRLATEYVDILWVHAWDYLTPVEEVMRALDDLVRQGKVLYVGISNAPAWIVSQANALAGARGWTPFAGIQVEYSLTERTAERELVPMATSLGLAVTAWSPLSGGILTGKYTRPSASASASRGESTERRLTERNLEIARTVDRVADGTGRSSAAVALRWLLQKSDPRGAAVIPIVGARLATQLDGLMAALDGELDDDHVAELDRVSAIPLGYPYDFLGTDRMRRLIYGDRAASIDPADRPTAGGVPPRARRP